MSLVPKWSPYPHLLIHPNHPSSLVVKSPSRACSFLSGVSFLPCFIAPFLILESLFSILNEALSQNSSEYKIYLIAFYFLKQNSASSYKQGKSSASSFGSKWFAHPSSCLSTWRATCSFRTLLLRLSRMGSRRGRTHSHSGVKIHFLLETRVNVHPPHWVEILTPFNFWGYIFIPSLTPSCLSSQVTELLNPLPPSVTGEMTSPALIRGVPGWNASCRLPAFPNPNASVQGIRLHLSFSLGCKIP